MTRTYDRDTKHYDRKVIAHLVETGQAQYYPAQGGIYVIKTEEGTVAVRTHQLIDLPQPVTLTDSEEVQVSSPMDGYCGQEQYDGEDIGPHGVVFQGLLALAEDYVAVLGLDTDPLVFVRRMLDDEEGEVEHAISEQVADARIAARATARRGFLTEAQEEDLLSKFL